MALVTVLNSVSANFCIEQGLLAGAETPRLCTWRWTYMTSTVAVFHIVTPARLSARFESVHEVALSTQLARLVSKAAEGRRVFTVRLEIGALRQVVPETLVYAWGFVTKNTQLEGAELDVTWVPVRLRCAEGHVTEKQGWGFGCDYCDASTTVVTGEEFRVIDIDVEAS